MTARQRRPFIVEAMVILPDHLHCIWTKSGKDAKGGMRFAFPPYGPFSYEKLPQTPTPNPICKKL